MQDLNGFFLLTKRFLIGVILVVGNRAYGHPLSALAQQADSLFHKNQFNKALELYENLFFAQSSYPLDALPKMSFMYGKKGDLAKSLYFLSIYYKQTNDDRVKKIIKHKAEEYELNGYNSDELNGLLRWGAEIKFGLRILGLALTCFIFSLLLYQKFKFKKLRWKNYYIAGILSAILVIVVNEYELPSEAIVIDKLTPLMSDPASSSELVGHAKQGDKLYLYADQDIWYKLYWNNQKMYVRQSAIWKLP